MGPNGSGKSTLAAVLAGREFVEVTEGTVSYYGKNLLEMTPEDRAKEGIFLGFSISNRDTGCEYGELHENCC